MFQNHQMHHRGLTMLEKCELAPEKSVECTRVMRVNRSVNARAMLPYAGVHETKNALDVRNERTLSTMLRLLGFGLVQALNGTVDVPQTGLNLRTPSSEWPFHRGVEV